MSADRAEFVTNSSISQMYFEYGRVDKIVDIVYSEHEEYILMRIRNVCKGGVDAVIDFVSSARTIKRSAGVLKDVR